MPKRISDLKVYHGLEQEEVEESRISFQLYMEAVRNSGGLVVRSLDSQTVGPSSIPQSANTFLEKNFVDNFFKISSSNFQPTPISWEGTL